MTKRWHWPQVADWGWFEEADAAGRFGGLVCADASPGDVAAIERGRLVFLATPYSARAVDAEGRWKYEYSQRQLALAAYSARWLAVAGVCAVSPVVLAVPMLGSSRPPQGMRDALDPLDGAAWAERYRPLFDACHAVVVARHSGWRQSAGIWSEVGRALAGNRRVWLMREGF